MLILSKYRVNAAHLQTGRQPVSDLEQDSSTNMHSDRTFVEQFTPSELMQLRSDLLQSGADSFQAAEIVTNFLSGRGYGVSAHEARTAASRIEVQGCKAEHIQAELERVAMAM
jgi:hypothetical protein